MLSRRLSVDSNAEEAKYRPYLNTGGPLDVINGKFIPTVDGNYVLSGGAGLTTAIVAKANMFKSTLQNSSAVNCMARFPESELHVKDSEFSAIDKNRLSEMSDLYLDEPEKRKAHLEDLKSRMSLYDPTTPRAENLDAFVDFMKEVRDIKVKNYKDWEVETELLDIDTGKPYRMLLPTLMSVDSWTQAAVKQLNLRYEEITAETDTSKQRMIFMEDSLKKVQLMNQLPGICAKGGIYMFMTGHIGKKISVDGKPLAKDMQFMKQDETTKAMGNKFEFLMSSIFQINSTQVLCGAADKKESEYPSSDPLNHISGVELQQLNLTLLRCKNTLSGFQSQLVSSQRFGIMTGLSYYNSLRNNKYYGLGSPNKVRNPFLDNTDIGRTKIFELSQEYKNRRALEITFQLFFIQNNWSLAKQPVDYSITIENLVEQLHKSSYAVDDILNSRGWWTYKGAKVDRDMLTLPDILRILTNNYKPKFLPVS